MLPTGSRTRGARGNRSRGSGRGSTSRGASSSSSTSPSTEPSNPFDQERLENAAKRAQRGQSDAMNNSRGGRGRGGPFQANKQVRFAESPAEKTFTKDSSPASTNPFATASKPAAYNFGTLASKPYNPFAAKENALANPFPLTSMSGSTSQPASTPATNVFGKPSNGISAANPFGTPSQPASTTSGIFGEPSGSSPATSSSNPFGNLSARGLNTPPATNAFGQPSGTNSSPAFASFGAPSGKTNGFPSQPNASSSKPSPKPFSSLSNGGRLNSSQSSSSSTKPFGQNGNTQSTRLSRPATQPSFANSNPESSDLAKAVYHTLQQDGIAAPPWPKVMPGDPRYAPAVDDYWRTCKDYRAKVRASLIRAGLLDDPDKPKKLSEAIDFKGICEEMCPDFERVTRINEQSVESAERTGGHVDLRKMVKALARSAAGQDAPLPMDVRSPAALRRTLDYLLDTILGDEEDNLPKVHSFLWDRTRAIRRDFVFQSTTLDTIGMVDQIYCLERITRFHVISLHQMLRPGVVTKDQFSEQQEVEQLSKSLLSLNHAYNDCNDLNIDCPNETEFRAYYTLFNCRNSGSLQTVQDWGRKVFEKADEVQAAVALIESLQNIWDVRGPLAPHSATDVAQNAFSKFFTIIEDKDVSYTLACFGEMHFNAVRKSILKTILASYRKQRDQTKDWTLSKLNVYLRFDDENEIISFGEQYGLRFDEVDGEDILSFESDEGPTDPFPPLPQAHSWTLVERKRGKHALPATIHANVFDESTPGEPNERVAEDDEESLFVPDNQTTSHVPIMPPVIEAATNLNGRPPASSNQLNQLGEGSKKTMSLFDATPKPTTFGTDFFAPKEPPTSAAAPNGITGSTLFQPLGSQPVLAKPSVALSSLPSPSTTPGNAASIFARPPEAPSTAQPQPSTSSIFSNSNLTMFPSSTLKATDSSTLKSSPGASTTTQPSALFNFSPQPAAVPDVTASTSFLSKELYSSTATATSAEALSPPLWNHPETTTPSFAFSASQTAPLASQRHEGLSTGAAKSISPPSLPVAPAYPACQYNPLESTQVSQSESIAGNNQAASSAPSSTPSNQEAKFAAAVQWFAAGEDGLIDQFTVCQVEKILEKAVKIYKKEEVARKTREKSEADKVDADAFRCRSVATRYFHRWQTIAQRARMRRRGRAARQARREMAEISRASKAAQSANMVAEFKASTAYQRRGSLESLLGATGVLDGVHDPIQEIRVISQAEPPVSTNKRSRADKLSDSHASNLVSKLNRHKRGKSNDLLRRSILSDPSYLTGGSRIHLMSKYDIKDEDRRQISGVQTDYFRLKARGIMTLQNGTSLASSAARSILRQNCSFDGATMRSTTPLHSRQSSIPRSAPPKTAPETDRPRTSEGRDEYIEDLKRRAKAIMSESDNPRSKRPLDIDDEALFERAKRVREQMDEGAEWYRREIERGSASRSMS
ncbi:SAC3/GANP/Nin1/mts3/eIF-3 p25 family-domain-containing protein [Amylocarpus encephaloides]|uniref:SAC3/GANP/Nin1/mts3/eIF-3 p25 family-domain-containing protein n=1 Tax=Amylocarpus encephaloides TaxID=45428 RepID=A0A9P8CAA3_9HELO|nr:SAC3/GANP/Nin1/mts3/eIF-3 p25 family-domain-containing protein [Amylocarpus encephaloides]